MKPPVEVKIEVEVSAVRMSELLCCALEGGSNYWYLIELADKNDAEFMHEAPMKGGWIEFSAMGDDGEFGDFWFGGCNRFRLDWDSMIKGLKVMAAKYPEHMRNFLDENDDAETGDVFLQCCLWGEVVFG